MQSTRQPVLIGVGQLVNRAADPREVMEPLEMMAAGASRSTVWAPPASTARSTA